jgi:hypothetical protein
MTEQKEHPYVTLIDEVKRFHIAMEKIMREMCDQRALLLKIELHLQDFLDRGREGENN